VQDGNAYAIQIPSGASIMRNLFLSVTFAITTILCPAAALAQAKLCDGVKYPVCCSAGSKAGCVANADDCKKLGGSVQTNTTAKGCNVVFPDYAGRVGNVPSTEPECAKLPARNGVWTAGGAITQDRTKPQSCSQSATCSAGNLSATESKCKPVVETKSPQSFTGTCVLSDPKRRDSGCSSCSNINTSTTPCRVSFVRK